MTQRVAIGRTTPAYNEDPPFDPDERYPELPISQVARTPNAPYRLLRSLLVELRCDLGAAGTAAWNPLGAWVRPGDTVVIKPNFVLSENASGASVFAVVTHPSVLRAVVDYVFVAIRGRGRIIIADVPQMDCQWERLMAAQRLESVQDLYRTKLGFDLEVMDLRRFELIDPRQPAYAANRRPRPGDPSGDVVVNLGRESQLFGLASDKFYGADHDRDETIAHHRGDTHEYCLSRTILAADVIVSVPKMKVHKKVGATLNLKGLVGCNTNKNYLVHYRVGSPAEGGDQLPGYRNHLEAAVLRVRRALSDHALGRQTWVGDMAYRVALKAYRSVIKPWRPVHAATLLQDGGNWHGNDSAWRMTADLARILYFADRDGKLHDRPQRRFFSVVDGIIGGERNGPLQPDARAAGCMVIGDNLLAVDLVATRAMGFDFRKLKQFTSLLDDSARFGFRDADEIEVRSSDAELRAMFASRSAVLGFAPHPGWVGHVEI